MKFKGYKILAEYREDEIHIDWASVKFSEGEYKKVKDENGINIDVYVRTKRLKKVDLPELGNVKTKQNSKGEELIKYTSEDFGVISTKEELEQFLNEQLDKVQGLEAVAEQACQH